MTSGRHSSSRDATHDMPSSIVTSNKESRYSTSETIFNHVKSPDKDRQYASGFERPSPDASSKRKLDARLFAPASSVNSIVNAYKTQNAANSTFNNEDDSLFDIPSIGKHTPLKMDRNNSDYKNSSKSSLQPVVYELSERNLKKFDESLKNNQHQQEETYANKKADDSKPNDLGSRNEVSANISNNRYSLIDYEYLDNSASKVTPSKTGLSSFPNEKSNKQGSSVVADEKLKSKNGLKESFLLDLKDTTIDEILLIADNFSIDQTHHTPSQSPERKKNSIQKSQISTPMSSPIKSPARKLMSKLTSSPSASKIPVLANKNDSFSKLNLTRSQDLSFEKNEQLCLEDTIENLNNDDTVEASPKKQNDDQQEIIRKNIEFARSNLLANSAKAQRVNALQDSPNQLEKGGNEKQTNYNSSSTITSDMTSASSYTSTSYKKLTKPSLTGSSSSSAGQGKEHKPQVNAKLNQKPETQSRSKPVPKSPAKPASNSKYGKRSESTSAVNAKNKPNSSVQRSNPKATIPVDKPKKQEIKQAHEITYSLDSEDASLLESTISNPTELKIRLKEELKRRKMTDELLDQLQENYDRLLEKHAEAENVIDSLRIGAKLNLEASNPNFYQTSQISQKQSAQQPTSITSLNGFYSLNGGNASKIVLTSDSHRNLNNGSSSTSFLINNNSASRSLSPTSSTKINTSDHIHQQQAPVGVILISSNKNKPQLDSFANKTLNDDEQNSFVDAGSLNSPPNLNQLENLVVDQTSRLGIILQTKVLEEKMHSFITLMDEQQLNLSEQRQVYDNIRTDYENLLKSYQEAKQNDPSGVLPNELDMDVDLNKELGKMKDLLENIVTRMSNNFAEKSPSGSILNGNDRSFRASSVSSYSNHDEIMDQYNRLLDVFNNDTSMRRKNRSGNASPKLSSSLIDQQNKFDPNESKLTKNNSMLSHNSETHVTNDLLPDANHSYSSTSTRKINKSNASSFSSKLIQENVNAFNEAHKSSDPGVETNKYVNENNFNSRQRAETPSSRVSSSLSRNSKSDDRRSSLASNNNQYAERSDQSSQKRASSFAPKQEKLYHEQKQQEKLRGEKSRVASENERASSGRSQVGANDHNVFRANPAALYHNHRNGHCRVDPVYNDDGKQVHSNERPHQHHHHHHHEKPLKAVHKNYRESYDYEQVDKTLSPGTSRSPSPLTYRQVYARANKGSAETKVDVPCRNLVDSNCADCLPGHSKERERPRKEERPSHSHARREECGIPHHHHHHHHPTSRKVLDTKILPRAKAYEGSETEEETDPMTHSSGRRYEQANEIYVSDSNDGMKLNRYGHGHHSHHHHHHRPVHQKHPAEYVEPKRVVKQSEHVCQSNHDHHGHHHHHHIRRHSSHNQNGQSDSDYGQSKLPRSRTIQKPIYDESPMEFDRDAISLETESDKIHRRSHHHHNHAHRPPVVEIKKPSKSKSELIKNLNDEVEILKQKILKTHKSDKHKYRSNQADDSYDDDETLVDQPDSNYKLGLKPKPYSGHHSIKKSKQHHEVNREFLRGSKSMENMNRLGATNAPRIVDPAAAQVPVGPYFIQAVPTDPAAFPQIVYAVHPAINGLPPSSSPTMVNPLSEINPNLQDPSRMSLSSNKFSMRANAAPVSPINPGPSLFNSASYIHAPVNPASSANRPQMKQNSKQPRKVRYYIREYGDITSDNEIAYRSFDDLSFNKADNSNRYSNANIQENSGAHSSIADDYNDPIDDSSLEDLLDRSFKFALIVNKKSKRIIEKIRSSSNMP